jgi:MFS family permease
MVFKKSKCWLPKGLVMVGKVDLLQRLRGSITLLQGNFLVLTLSWVIMSPAMNMVFTYEQPYLLALGATPILLGIIYAISTVILSIVRLPGGYIADRFGRKKIVVTMTFGVAFSYLFYAYAPSWHWFLVGSIFNSVCLIYQPALMACLADSVPSERRGVAFAVRNFLPSLFSIPAPLVALYFVSTFGLVEGMRLAYLATTGMVLMAASLRWFCLKETLVEEQGLAKIKGPNGFLKDFKNEYVEAINFLLGSLPAFAVFYILFNFAQMGVGPLWAIYIIFYLGIGKENWGLIRTISSIVSLLAFVPMGFFVDKIGRRKVLMIGLSVFFLSSLLFTMMQSNTEYSLPLALLSFAILTFASASTGIALSAFEADMVPREKRGRVLASLAIVSSLAGAIGQALSGFEYERIDPRFPFIKLTILMAACFLIVYFFIKEPAKRES